MDTRSKDPYRIAAYVYDLIVSSPNSMQKRQRLRVAPARRGMRVLDVGCGTGSDLQLYARSGCRVYGVDVSPAMLKMAEKRLGSEADLRLGSAARLPFTADGFDLVMASYTLHEIEPGERSAMVAEMKRVAKPEGRILITDFLAGPYRALRGWVHTTVRYMYERLAGGEHFRNGREFLRRGGLDALVAGSGLKVSEAYRLRGGAVGMVLLQKNDSVGG